MRKGKLLRHLKGFAPRKMEINQRLFPLCWALRKQLERVDCDTKLPSLAFPNTHRNESLYQLQESCTLRGCY
jgi:hypothetical protein